MGRKSAVAVAVVAAVTLGACSGTEPEEPRFLTATSMLSSVRAAMKDAGSVAYVVTHEQERTWGSTTLDGSRNRAEFARGVPVLNTDGTTTTPEGPTFLRTSDIVCTSSPDATDKTPWGCTYDTRAFGLLDPDTLSYNPTTWIAKIGSATALKALGKQRLGDISTERYRIKATMTGGASVPEATIELWLDADNRPVKIDMTDVWHTSGVDGGPTTSYVATLRDYGSKIDLTPPPRDQMFDIVQATMVSQSGAAKACYQSGTCPKQTIPPPDPHPND